MGSEPRYSGDLTVVPALDTHARQVVTEHSDSDVVEISEDGSTVSVFDSVEVHSVRQ